MNEMKSKPGKKILIVEDDEVDRKVMDLQFSKYYHLTLAKDGYQALELFSHNIIQL